MGLTVSRKRAKNLVVKPKTFQKIVTFSLKKKLTVKIFSSDDVAL